MGWGGEWQERLNNKLGVMVMIIQGFGVSFITFSTLGSGFFTNRPIPHPFLKRRSATQRKWKKRRRLYLLQLLTVMAMMAVGGRFKRPLLNKIRHLVEKVFTYMKSVGTKLWAV